MSSWFNAFLFFLPAGVANMAPVFANRIPLLNRWKTSLDFGKTYQGKRIFGDNKTWRGLVTGVVAAGLVANFEATWAYHALSQDRFWFVLAGMLMGFGALTGDAAESFFKRQYGIKPGHNWFPFDQIDYIIGGLLAVAPFIRWYPSLILDVFVIYFGLHLLISKIGYLLGLKTKPV